MTTNCDKCARAEDWRKRGDELRDYAERLIRADGGSTVESQDAEEAAADWYRAAGALDWHRHEGDDPGNAYVPDGEEDRIDAEGAYSDRWRLIEESDEREALNDYPFSGRIGAGEY